MSDTALSMQLTDAGLAELTNAQQTGTAAVTITHIALGSAGYTPSREQTALTNEVTRLNTLGGTVVDAHTLSVSVRDEGGSTYTVREFGLITDQGTLLAVYSQAAPIIEKAGASTLLLTADIRLDEITTEALEFGDILFSNPPASEVIQGVTRYASVAQAVAGVRHDRAVTPKGLSAAVEARAFRVALTGPGLIYPGTSNDYTITNFDDFASYQVAVSRGSVSRSGNLVTVTLGAGEPDGPLDLTITRNGAAVLYPLAVGAPTVRTPSIVLPEEGDTDVALTPTLQSSAYGTYPPGHDTHTHSDWQIADDPGFGAGSIVWESLATTSELQSITVGSDLPLNTTLYARVRHTGSTLGTSSWSAPVSFTTTDMFIQRPSVTSPWSGQSDIPDEPTFTASAFATTPAGSDTHAATSWRLRDAGGSIIWQSLTNTQALTSITLPAGVLQDGETAYSLEVQHHGNNLPASDWSNAAAFTTELAFAFVEAPSITSPSDGAVEIPEQPILECAPFSVFNGSDTHVASYWQVYQGGSLVYQTGRTTSALTALTLPAGILEDGATAYQVRVRHEGDELGLSEWSPWSSFTTMSQFVPEDGEAGTPFGGGYFVRRMKDEAGDWYALIVSPRGAGLGDVGSTSWSAFMGYVADLVIGSHSDWRLPTRDEARILYRELKPTADSNRTSYGATDKVEPPLSDYTSSNPGQTNLVEWQDGGSEAFLPRSYWTSDEDESNPDDAWRLYFDDGLETTPSKMFGQARGRAVRRHYL